ncbi:Oxalate oxidase GF-3.8 [Trichinella pseudospiralis]
MKAVFGLLLTACCNHATNPHCLQDFCDMSKEGIWHYLTCTCKRFTQPREDANRKNLLDEEADFNMRENKLNGC